MLSRSIGPETLAKSFVAVQPYAAPQGRPWEIFNDALLESSTDVPNPGQWSSDPYTISDYDAVTIVALAMVAAGTPDPAVFNPYVRTVTKGGANTVQVHSYTEGLTALGTGHSIQYVGPSGPMAFDQWQNAPGGFSVAVYDPSGETKLIESITASAIGELSRPAGRYFAGGRSRAIAPAIATAQTGAMVITNGRIVSLAECESRSKAMKTMTVPKSSRTKPAMSPGHLSDFIVA